MRHSTDLPVTRLLFRHHTLLFLWFPMQWTCKSTKTPTDFELDYIQKNLYKIHILYTIIHSPVRLVYNVSTNSLGYSFHRTCFFVHGNALSFGYIITIKPNCVIRCNWLKQMNIQQYAMQAKETQSNQWIWLAIVTVHSYPYIHIGNFVTQNYE